MGRLSKKDMEELKEFCSFGCDYSDCKQEIMESANETLKELGIVGLDVDCMVIVDGDKEGWLPLEDFIVSFYEKVSEKILNVVETQGR